MLKEFLKDNMQIVDSVIDWQDAIRVAGKPLVDNKVIEERYIQTTIDCILKNGPYVVITDGVAMPHSRPEDGVIKKGMSFLKVKNGVDFYKTDEKVYLFFTLAAEDSDGHQDAIAELAEFLDDEDKVQKIIKEDLTEEEILNLI